MIIPHIELRPQVIILNAGGGIKEKGRDIDPAIENVRGGVGRINIRNEGLRQILNFFCAETLAESAAVLEESATEGVEPVPLWHPERTVGKSTAKKNL